MRALLRVGTFVQITGLLLQPQLPAQSPNVGIGARVRVTTGRAVASRTGEVVAYTNDSLVIATPGSTWLAFRRAEILRMPCQWQMSFRIVDRHRTAANL